MKVVLAGGSGSLGRRIADHLRAHDHEIAVLTRNNAMHGPDRYAVWDGVSVGGWSDELNGLSRPTPAALVHAGAPILRTDPALAPSGRRGLPTRLLERNFHFERARLQPALADLLGDHTRRA